MQSRELTSREQEVAKQSMRSRKGKQLCGIEVGTEFEVEGEIYQYVDAQLEGSGVEYILYDLDCKTVLTGVKREEMNPFYSKP